MDCIDIARNLIFKNMDIKENKTFEDRILIQKKVYLLKEVGLDLGFDYKWFKRGPYSPTLAEYVYDNWGVLQVNLKNYSLKDKAIKKTDSVTQLGNARPAILKSLTDWYELLASLCYIQKNYHAFDSERNPRKDSIIEILLNEKPKYNEDERGAELCNTAIQTLREEGIKIGA